MATASIKSEVTLALPSDEGAIMDLLRVRHQEEGVGSFDDECVLLTLRRGIYRNFAMVGVVRGKGGAVEASIGLYVDQPWYSKEGYLSDRWAVVGVGFRKSEHAKSMLQFAKWAATELGFPLVMTMIQNEATEGKTKLYERQLPKAGSLFIFKPELQPAA